MEHILQHWQSVLLYTAVLAGCLILSLFVKREGGQRRNYALLLGILIVMSLLCGLRGSTVGRDTASYLAMIQNGGYETSMRDFGFILCIRALRVLLGEAAGPAVFLLASFTTNALILATLYYFRRECNFTVSLFVFLTTYYFLTFSGMRQWIAVSMVAYAITQLHRCRPLRYLLLCALACTFHFSAVFSIVFLLIYLAIGMKDKHYEKRRKMRKFFLAISPLLLVGAGVAVWWLYTRYAYLWRNEEYWRDGKLGGMVFLFGFCLLLLWVVAVRSRRRHPTHPIWENSVGVLLPLGLFMRFFAHVLGTFIGNMGRVEWYTAIPFCLLIGALCQPKGETLPLPHIQVKRRYGTLSEPDCDRLLLDILRLLLLAVSAYEFIYLMRTETTMLLPYIPFFF